MDYGICRFTVELQVRRNSGESWLQNIKASEFWIPLWYASKFLPKGSPNVVAAVWNAENILV